MYAYLSCVFFMVNENARILHNPKSLAFHMQVYAFNYEQQCALCPENFFFSIKLKFNFNRKSNNFLLHSDGVNLLQMGAFI